jgi:hypothetical protein
MAEQHAPVNLTNTKVVIHSVPLPGEAKVLMLVEANAQVTHVLSLEAQAVRQLVVGLLDALDVVTLDDDMTPDDIAGGDAGEDQEERG